MLNGKTYRQVHLHNIYSVSASQSSATQSLVDHGANGDIDGSDVHVIYKTHCSVDAQGFINHQMVDIPITTVGGVINTQQGKVIAILHQYAYTGLGTSIHSPAQLEWYKNDVNDRSIKVGGLQRITTLEGYVIPLNFVQGLPRMAIRPYTDKEWEDLPHVVLTSELDWDPGQLDLALDDDDNWYDAISDLAADPFTNRFDEYGDYRHRVEVQATEVVDSLDDVIDQCTYAAHQHDTTAVPSEPSTEPRTVTAKERDYQALRPLFGWLPTDTIKCTFEATTQYARIPMSTILKKHFQSPNPALNVQRQHEPVTTDTVYSDTPAIDSGVTTAQFFVGCESMVFSGCVALGNGLDDR